MVQKALAFFGPKGLGLEVQKVSESLAHFEGGGGYVLVQAQPKGKGSEIVLMAREWEYPAKQFLGQT